jgi:FkbM family methyltransferase
VSLIARLRSGVAVYRRLSAAGVRRSSLLLFPLRRRIPPRRTQLDLVEGGRLTARPDEPLLSLFDEVWVRDSYLPAGWRPRENALVVDVGANVGTFAVYAHRRLKAQRVVAVEPDPGCARDLLENLRRNGVDATVIQAAVGGEAREATLYRRGPTSDMNTLFDRDVYGSRFVAETRVRVVTLDALFALIGVERCDLLKLDCEGAEYEALAAAGAETLAKVDHVVLEWHVGLNDHRPEELQSLLEGHGFRVARFPPLDVEGGLLHASRPR